MTNLRIDEMVLFCILTKIGADKNKAIYSICLTNKGDFAQCSLSSKCHLRYFQSIIRGDVQCWIVIAFLESQD